MMNMTQPEKYWLAIQPYDQNLIVYAHFDADTNMWKVRQGKKTVILCTNLYLKNAEFHPTKPVIRGYICTWKEINDLHAGDDDTHEYTCVQRENGKWVDEFNVPIVRCDYADMCARELDQILAIYVTKLV